MIKLKHLMIVLILILFIILASLSLRKNQNNQNFTPITQSSSKSIIRGNRSRQNIINTIMSNNETFREDFNRRQKEIPNLKGKVVVRIVVDQMGNVIECKIKNKTTSLKDELLHNKLKERIFKLNFGPIEIENDTTEFIFPFVFTS